MPKYNYDTKPMLPKAFTLTEELVEQITAEAKERLVSGSVVVRDALREHFARGRK